MTDDNFQQSDRITLERIAERQRGLIAQVERVERECKERDAAMAKEAKERDEKRDKDTASRDAKADRRQGRMEIAMGSLVLATAAYGIQLILDKIGAPPL